MGRLTALSRTADLLRGSRRPVSLLAAGTLLAQTLPVLLAPVLTRLYSPDDYGALAWAVSIVTVVTLIASGTYDQAVNLPPERTVAAALVFGMVVAGAGAALVLVAAAVVEWRWRGVTPARLWFVPAATGLTVAFNAVAAWANREARFGGLAAGRVALATIGVTVTLALGVRGWGEAGLMTGNLAGLVGGLVVLVVAVGWKSPVPRNGGNPRMIWQAMAAHRRFPALLLPSSLLNTVTNQLPVWFLHRLFGSGVVGHYALMNRVLSVPVSLIGSSAGEVFRQRAAAEFRETGQSAQSWAAFSRPLAGVALPMGLVLLAFGPVLFAWIFGEPWREAGRYAQVLSLFFILRCCASPLSYMLILAQRQGLDLALQICCLGGALLAWAAGAITDSPMIALGVFGGTYSMVYLVYYAVSRRLAHGPVGATP